jgi:LPXTG-motif cell wall-anchored protein
VQLASSPRRALGLVAVGAIGMSTAVLGATGVAQAAPLTPIAFTVANSPLTIEAGYCTVDWKLVGGSGGTAEDGTAGAKGGELVITTDVRKDDTFTLFPGTAGSAGAGGIGGAGGTNADGQGNGGLIGTTPDPAGTGGGGGGAATTVRAGGSPFLFAFGGNGGDADTVTSAGLGQGNGENRKNNMRVNSTVTTAPLGDGSISGTVQPCLPGTPAVNWITGGEKSATLQIWRGSIPEGDTSTPAYQYSLDGGAWQSLVSGGEYQYEPTITGLTNGTQYSVRVRMTTDRGASAPTAAKTVTPHHVPGAPANATATAGPGSITITWDPPAGESGITGYEAWAGPSGQQNSGGVIMCEGLTADSRSCVLTVQPGLVYEVGVRTLDGDTAFVTTAKVPAAATLPKSDGEMKAPAGASAPLAPGESRTLTGTGYAPFSTVTLIMYSEPQILTTVETDANGSFEVTVTVPAGTPAGEHTFVATGVDAAGNVRNTTLKVIVAGDGTAKLAATGADIALPMLAGLGALAIGGGLLFAARRRSAA